MERFKETMMGESRHHFVYGYDTTKRKEFCESLEKSYPIVMDSDKPMGIYLEEYGLPNIEYDKGLVDMYETWSISREYLWFSIIYRILSNAKESVGFDELNKRVQELINRLNRGFKTPGFKDIQDLNHLLAVFKESIEFYLESYKNYVLNMERVQIDSVPIPFMNLEFFVKRFKESINNQSYFGVIINNNKDIALSSVQAINDLVGSRINGDISMKIVTEPDKWKSYRCTRDDFVQSVHDYGTIELDDSLRDNIKSLKNN